MSDMAEILRAFRGAVAHRDSWKSVRLARLGIDRLPDWVAARRSAALGTPTAPLPADFLQLGCLLLGCAGDTAALAAARSAVERIPELAPCRACVERGEIALRTAEALLRLAAQRPGNTVAELAHSLLGVDEGLLSQVCFWLGELGRLERRRPGADPSLRLVPHDSQAPAAGGPSPD